MDHVSVLASLTILLLGVHLGVLRVLGAGRVSVVAATHQGQTARATKTNLEAESRSKRDPPPAFSKFIRGLDFGALAPPTGDAVPQQKHQCLYLIFLQT